MAQNISLKINCKKIEKPRLYVGSKGTYLDATIIMWDEPDRYGNDGMIVQKISAEERRAGMKGMVLGSAKYFQRNGPPPPGTVVVTPMEMKNDDDDLPF